MMVDEEKVLLIELNPAYAPNVTVEVPAVLKKPEE
jgi:hypothetical protein